MTMAEDLDSILYLKQLLFGLGEPVFPRKEVAGEGLRVAVTKKPTRNEWFK